MSSNTIPSRVRSLSLAISQTVLITGGLSAGALQAQAAPMCTVSAAPGQTLTVNSKVDGNACRYSEGAVVLNSGSGVNKVSDEEYSAYATAVSVRANEYGGNATVTLNGSSTVVNSQAISEKNRATSYGIDTDLGNKYAGSTTTIELSSSSVKATSTGKIGAESAAIVAESTSNNYYYAPRIAAVVLNVDPVAPPAAPANSADVTVDLEDTTVEASSESSGFARAAGVAANADAQDRLGDATTDVAIKGGKTAVKVTVAGEGYALYESNEAVGIDAYSEAYSGASETSVTLNETELSVDIDVDLDDNGYGGAVSVAMGVYASADSEGDADTLVTLNSSALSAQASSSNTSDGLTSTARSMGIIASSYSYDSSSQSGVVLNGGASVDVSAEADVAVAAAVIASSYSDDDESSASVTLDDTSISVSVSGKDAARAIAIYADADVVDLDVTNSAIEVTAEGADNNSVASGISAEGRDVTTITLTGSTINVNADSNYSEGGAYAKGGSDISAAISVSAYSNDASVTLNSSHIKVVNNGDGPSVGIYESRGYAEGLAKGETPFTVTLDSASSIDAQYAVVAFSESSVLNNAGDITGNVIMANVNNSGKITGHVEAGELNVSAGGVIAGTSQSENLNVDAGGELQAIMTPDVDSEVAHFVAEKATLEDGAKININGSSELFKPEFTGVTYRIVETADDSSLVADIEQLVLLSSGLISVAWEDCGAANLCVNVRALNLEELAIGDDASGNGVDAAAAAQSLLEQLSGTETADAFMRVMERVVDGESWEQIDGSGQGEGLLASRGSERVVSRYVQRMMQQGRSSGEEFVGAQGLWIQALNADGDGDSDNGVAGFEVDTTGLAIGYDAELKPGLIIGGAISTTDSQIDADDNSSTVDSSHLMATVYGQWIQGPLFANALMTYGRGDNESTRFAVSDRIDADYDSDYLSFRMQAGKAYGFESGWQLRPRVEFVYSNVDMDSYDETGSVLALSVDSQSYETLELGAGIEISKPFIVERAVITPYIDFAVYHDFADDAIQTNSRFVIGGNDFVTRGADVEQTNISATFGLGYAVGANHTLKAAYEYFGNSNYDSASWMLRYSYGF